MVYSLLGYEEFFEEFLLHKKISFPLRVFSVNLTKFAVFYGKRHFLCSVLILLLVEEQLNLKRSLTWPTVATCFTGRHPNSDRNGLAAAQATAAPCGPIEYPTRPLGLYSKLK